MSSGLTSISYYELYVRQPRGWELHARYADEGKDKATQEAQVFEGTGKGVKIIRETYYPDKNKSTELVVYVSRNLSKEEAAFDKEAARQRKEETSGGDDNGGGGDWGAPEPDDEFQFEEVGTKPKKKKKKKRKPRASNAPDPSVGRTNKKKKKKPQGITLIDLLMRILFIGATGAVIGGIATGLSSMLLGQLPKFGIAVSPNMYLTALLGIFVFAFLVTVVPLSIRFVQLDELRKKGGGQDQQAATGPGTAKGSFGALFQKHKEQGAKDEAGGLSFDFKYDDEPDPEEEKAEAQTETEEPALEEPEEPEPEEKTEEKEEEDEAEDDGAPHKGISEGDRLAMTKFLGGVVTSIKGSRPQLDSYNKFGVLLLIAGANDIMGEMQNFSEKDRVKLLRETIEVMGTKPDLAKSFCSKLEEYFMEPRYMPMIQAGRESMKEFINKGGDPFSEIKHVFELWNKPTGKSADQGVMTVMFTDMVGSTNLTQTKGDFGAQDVVRQHNQVVRTALNMHSGTEVKHTGDGIMASFTSAGSAVDACIDIQKMVAEQNAKSGSDALRLRIGLNAGEPIQEENDLFGTTVQLAARICDKAGTDKILVSNVVRELSSGRAYNFVSRGAFELKGVNEPQTLYEVVWNADAPVEQAAPTAAPMTQAAPVKASRAQAAATAPPQTVTSAPTTTPQEEQNKPRPHLKQNPFSMK